MGEIILKAMIENNNYTYDEETDTIYVYDKSVETCTDDDLKYIEFMSLIKDDKGKPIGIKFEGFRKHIKDSIKQNHPEGDDENVTF